MNTSIILIFLSIILRSQAQVEVKDQALIQSTCKNTPHVQLCIATLNADHRSAVADVRGLSLIMVAVVKAKTKVALSVVNKLAKSGHPYLTPALQECTEVYKAVLKGDVAMAVEALTKGNFKFAETGMADTVLEADICEGSFERLKVKSPMTGVNRSVHDLAEVARAIIRNLL